MGKRLLFILVICMLLITAMPVYAADINGIDLDDEIVYYDDGSFAVISLQVDDGTRGGTKTASKSYKFYNSSDVLQWTFKVTGTFSYTGTSATATAVSTSYSISKNCWSYGHATKSKSGNTVTGTGYFINSGNTKSGTVTIKCSKTGVIS